MLEHDEATPSLAQHVAVLAPLGRDAALILGLLERASVPAVPMNAWPELARAVRTGLGALVLTQESLTSSEMAELSAALREQPPWSELPVVLLLAQDQARMRSPCAALTALVSTVGVVVQQRPVPRITLGSYVQAALNARRRQYQVRDLLVRERLARDTAETAMRVKDEFLTVVSHELRTPVSAMVIWAQLLAGGTLKSAQLGRAVQAILSSAESQQRLIEDLLDVGRMLTGKLVIHPVRQPIEPLLEAALETLRPMAEAKGVQLALHVEPGVGTVTLDAERMQQVFWNLLSNAVKFTPMDGRVTASLAREGDSVRIVVRDTGQGIAASALPRVFERFGQEDATMTRRHGGLGLGLAIVRQLVELHGGEVMAESAGPGKGATFTVRLPSAGERPPSQPEPPLAVTRRDAPLQGVRVLLVEDGPEMRLALTWTLENAGAEVEAVEAADSALSTLRAAEPTRRPHVLVSDLGLPGKDGMTLVRSVRDLEQQLGQAALPAIAITAHAFDALRERALEAGFQRFLAKPITAATLVATVAELLRTQAAS